MNMLFQLKAEFSCLLEIDHVVIYVPYVLRNVACGGLCEASESSGSEWQYSSGSAPDHENHSKR